MPANGSNYTDTFNESEEATTKKHVVQALRYSYVKVLPLGVYGFVHAETFEIRCGSSMTLVLNYSKVMRIMLPHYGNPVITLW